MPTPPKNEIGNRYGRLLVVARAHTDGRRARWVVRCDCGNEKTVDGQNLRRGRAVSCGCYIREVFKMKRDKRHAACVTHGLSNSPEYETWKSMIRRCTDPSDQAFHNYGGRGISVCSRWLQSLEGFIADMGKRPSGAYSIDRIDVNGNYEPGNCRWATASEQARNKRNTRWLEHDGKRMPLVDMARRHGIRPSTLCNRLARGMSVAVALSTPVKRSA